MLFLLLTLEDFAEGASTEFLDHSVALVQNLLPLLKHID